MKTFLFRSMIGIFFGAFLAVVFTNLYVISNDRIMLDGTLFLKTRLALSFAVGFSRSAPSILKILIYGFISKRHYILSRLSYCISF
ncbi:hypothetical protein [Psychrobacillus sp. NEAU-3TGS]|uniref:hypothetical protein n=1 Tax=Psychrobacillus sp. NEAU-3TGS TaxID=2995412 RepID=UPI0032B43345